MTIIRVGMKKDNSWIDPIGNDLQTKRGIPAKRHSKPNNIIGIASLNFAYNLHMCG